MTPRILLVAGLAGSAAANNVQCKSFSEIYPSGEALAHNMWDGAFQYVNKSSSNYSNAYDMWFTPTSSSNYSNVNPNEAKVDANIKAGFLHPDFDDNEQCHLNYFHHSGAPKPMASTEHVCSPWQRSSCCKPKTVASAKGLKEGYGADYHWDRCGPLSFECETFFVQEACFYECEPAAGFYRKFQNASVVGVEHPDAHNASNNDHNEWQLKGLPIKGDYFDRWLAACSNDKFCSTDSGSYFSCAAVYANITAATLRESEAELAAALANITAATLRESEAELAAALAKLEEQKSNEEGLTGGAIAGIIVATCVAVLALVSVAVLVRKEKSGNPVFTKMGSDGAAAGKADIPGNDDREVNNINDQVASVSV